MHFFEIRSSEKRTEPTYHALYWSWHSRTPKPDRFLGRLLESRFLLEEHSKDILKFFALLGDNFFQGFNNWTCGLWSTQRIQQFCNGTGYLRRTECHQGSPFFQKYPYFPYPSLSFMQTNSGVPNAAPRTSKPEISLHFLFILSVSKSTVDQSLHLPTLLWRPHSGPSSHRRYQDLMRSSSEPTKTPSSRY